MTAGSHTITGIPQIKRLETRAQDVLRFILSLQNLSQPVNRLPPEILSRIAQYSLNAAVDARPIVPLTHVRRYWRDSITSDPANWTLISNFNKDLMASTLERAKATPLQVTIVPRNGLSSYRVPARYTQNISTLRFTKFSIEKLRQAIPGFPQSTPSLRSLWLGFAAEIVWDRSVDPFESLTPTLGSLELFHVPLYPSILHLRSLTEFTYRSSEFDPHVDTLLDFLEENHSLKYVGLCVVFREDSHRRSRRRTPTRNQLRRPTIISQHAMDARALISGIGLQRGARLDIMTYLGARLNDILSGAAPLTHISNARSSTLDPIRGKSD